MNTETSPFYRHSGKFNLGGLALAVIVPLAAGFPLGLLYAYLVRWIPFIYVNFFISAGYGFALGIAASWLLKRGKVRNNKLAFLCGLTTSLGALYFAWSAHFHALMGSAGAPLGPDQLWHGIQYLYEHGSWALRGGNNVTGVILAIVWVVEALIIVIVCLLASLALVLGTPFCERSGCWLDEEKKINTLEAFTQPEQLAALKAGDLRILTQARPKLEGATTFARLTLKHSPRCEDFCTVTVANVTVTTDDKGSVSEKSQELADNIVLPKTMFEQLSKLEQVKPAAAPAA